MTRLTHDREKYLRQQIKEPHCCRVCECDSRDVPELLAEIDALRAENEIMKQYESSLLKIAHKERDAALARVEKLRGTLEKIIGLFKTGYRCSLDEPTNYSNSPFLVGQMGGIAHSALCEDDKAAREDD